MKTFSDIYKSIVNSIQSKIGVEIQKGTFVDAYTKAASEIIEDAYIEIENSKNPHIYTKLQGEDIDKYGVLINCTRENDESDRNYLKRCMDWTLNNQSSNRTSIENAILNLRYSSNATYVPYTFGTGTATVYVIPNEYTDETIALAKQEAYDKLKKVVSPDSYISVVTPKPIYVRILIYASFNEGDVENAKRNIERSIEEYVNNIPIGESLSYGAINKIGVNEKNVEYFNATHIYFLEENSSEAGTLISALNSLQTVESKFLFNDIIWMTAVN